jgi:hypothetical protein
MPSTLGLGCAAAMTERDPLNRLQSWYESHCDGDWEHDKRIRIGTLDNPGWRVYINLADNLLPLGRSRRDGRADGGRLDARLGGGQRLERRGWAAESRGTDPHLPRLGRRLTVPIK